MILGKDTMGIKHVHSIALVATLVFGLAGSAFAADVNKLVAGCADCHGKNGASTEPDIPIIGGYSDEFLTDNLKAYKEKERVCPETKIRTGSKKGTKTDMCQVVKPMSEDDINQIAQYFSKQKFVRAKQKFDPALAKKGKEVHDQYCEKCHSEGGTVADDDAGMPAGQWMPYLRHAFDEFYTGKRPIAKKMKIKLDEISKSDVEALINFYGSISK
jgi:sulfide dehydrogenase cytochrome subunit